MYYNYGKRLMDLVLAAAIAPLAAAACVICILLIRLDSQGPAVFRQLRVGRNKVPFVLYKLRTMSFGTENRASHEISSSRITRIGHFLRRTKLDELPQLINVLKGDMSFVGPRPCLPNQHLLISERDRLGVFRAAPGITGAAQLSGIDMSTPLELAEADAAYVRNIQFKDDLKFLYRTASGRGHGDAVSSN